MIKNVTGKNNNGFRTAVPYNYKKGVAENVM